MSGRWELRRMGLLGWVIVVAAVFVQRAEAQDAGEPFPAVAPETVGVSAEDLQSIVTQVKQWVDDGEVMGAEIHIIKNRKTVLHESVGWMDKERNKPMQNNTIFCVRSMTKPVVGTAIQMLIDEGKISLDDPASKYLPSFDNEKSKKILIRHLLNHTSGLPLSLIDKPLAEYTDIGQVAATAGAHGPDFESGSKFQYSDEGADALGAIVAAVSGMSLDEFVQKRILNPLGMADSMCALTAADSRYARVATLYVGSAKNWTSHWTSAMPTSIFPFLLASQSLYSTTTDYAKFMAMWIDRGQIVVNGADKRIISDDAIHRALDKSIAFTGYPSALDDHLVEYGQLWTINRQQPGAGMLPALPIFGHSGSDGTLAMAIPDRNLMVLYFSQSRNGPTALKFESLIRPLIGQTKKALARPQTAAEMEPLTGFYFMEVMDAYMCVYVAESRLVLEIPGQDAFVLNWPDERGQWEFQRGPGILVKFDPAVNGRSPGFTLTQGGMEYKTPRHVPPADLPTVDDLQALRRKTQGEDDLKALKNFRLTGEVNLETRNARGSATLLIEGAGRYLYRMDVDRVDAPNSYDSTAVKDGEAWMASTPAPTPAQQEGVYRGQKLRAFQPYRLADWKDLFKDVVVVRRATWGGGDEPVVMLRAVPFDGNAVRIFVSEKTGLTLNELSLPVIRGHGTLPTSATYEDYREVNGVLIPFRVITENLLAGKIVIQFKDVQANLELAPDAFELKPPPLVPESPLAPNQ